MNPATVASTALIAVPSPYGLAGAAILGLAKSLLKSTIQTRLASAVAAGTKAVLPGSTAVTAQLVLAAINDVSKAALGADIPTWISGRACDAAWAWAYGHASTRAASEGTQPNARPAQKSAFVESVQGGIIAVSANLHGAWTSDDAARALLKAAILPDELVALIVGGLPPGVARRDFSDYILSQKRWPPDLVAEGFRRINGA